MPPAPLSERRARLWRLMQRVELCRHHAVLAEEMAASGAPQNRHAMREVAMQWRLCAEHLQLLHRTATPAVFPPIGELAEPRARLAGKT